MGKPVHEMSADEQRIGQCGENEAADFLSNLGYEIIARKVHTRRGEIGIAATPVEGMLLVDLRTLTPGRMARPEEMITRRKQSHTQTAMEVTLRRRELTIGKSMRWLLKENRAANPSSPILTTF